MNSVIFLFTLIVFLAGCRKTDPALPADETPKGKLLLHLHSYLELNEVDKYGVIYTDSEGRKISATNTQMFISNVELIRYDNTAYKVPDLIILQKQGTYTYVIGDVPVGNYKTIRFGVGLNQNDALKSPSGDLGDPSMWLGPSSKADGYVNLSFKGKIDTTSTANGSEAQMQEFEYRIGTSRHYRTVAMPEKPFVIARQTQYIHMTADYMKLFAGIDLSQPSNLKIVSETDNALPLSEKIMSNIQYVFAYEE
jgi:hypothetical protein